MLFLLLFLASLLFLQFLLTFPFVFSYDCNADFSLCAPICCPSLAWPVCGLSLGPQVQLPVIPVNSSSVLYSSTAAAMRVATGHLRELQAAPTVSDDARKVVDGWVDSE